MREDEFRTWLAEGGAESGKAQDTRISALRKLEKSLARLGFGFADLEEAYAADKFASLLQKLAELRANARDGGERFRILLPESKAGDIRLSYWQSWLKRYGTFLSGEKHGGKDADRIRRHVLETYIEPARERDEESVEVHVRTVHDALDLQQAWRNVCQSLTGDKFLDMADVFPPERIGAEYSSATRYRFDLTGTARIDWGALAALKQAFETLHPDLTTFADCASFVKGEGSYKHLLVARAVELVEAHKADDDATLGAALLDLASGKGGLFSNLIDWRASGMVDEVRASHPGLLETALGRMARSQDEPASAVIACVDAFWPAFIEGQSSKPYAESRMVPTMVMGLVRPDAVLGIRSTPTDNAHKMLLGKPAFAWNRLTRPELDSVLAMAGEIFRVMRDDWGWAPRDLWDVQGFIWETCQKIAAAPADPAPEPRSETPMPSPTNLILYGPPGTGKTYTTALEAVRLCGEEVPDDRDALMALYRSLQHKGRIGFVTFHQNFAYEDFVEGLRPITGDGAEGSAGFSLSPEPGVFRRMADMAAKPVASSAAFSFDGRRIFKLSLGESGKAAWNWVYEQSIEDGYALFGFRDVDWSDDRFSNREVILAELQSWFPDEKITPQTGIVKSPDRFRNQIGIGDVVIISKGLNAFRAIGVVEGEYEYAPREGGSYCHRRKVRWLWEEPEGVPVGEISATRFSLDTVYELPRERLNLDVLARYIAGADEEAQDSGALLPHVLIIDEINRANISKVFGELITLLEPDKRLGMPNALTVRLPYSKTEFGVPANLHVIGTMNTADRSIALLDTALRRRFTFREMAPRPDLLDPVEGIDLKALLTAINRRIEYLLDREHRIGHAFFMGLAARADIDAVMRDKVIPLLQEYFFEDWGRIRAVLGGGFIGVATLPPPPGMQDHAARETWFVRWDEPARPEAFPADAYALLLSGAEPSDDAQGESQGE